MFKKCLKYDLRSCRKIWLIAAAVMLLISILGGLGMACLNGGIAIMSMNESEDAGLLIFPVIAMMIIGMLAYVATIYSVALFAGGINIMVYIRYFTHFFTDQGYLTFTLPVKRSTLFWSKTVSGMIYMLATLAVSFVSILNMIIGFFIPSLISPQAAAALGIDFADFFVGITLADVLYAFVLIVLSLVLIVAIEFASLMLQYLIITVSATLFRNLKIVSVIVAYIGSGAIMTIFYFLTYLINMIYLTFMLAFLSMGLVSLFTVPILGWLGIYALILVACAAAVTLGLIFANFAMQRLDRKLNLA